MHPGLYEQIISLLISKRVPSLGDRAKLESLDGADSHDFLAQYLYRVLLKGLAQVVPDTGIRSAADRAENRIDKQVKLCNEILDVLSDAGIDGLKDAHISPEAKRLMSVLRTASQKPIVRPDTPLALGALLTGTRQDPSLISQLKKEILSSDRIDILCSFIKWSGIRILSDALREFTTREGTRLRVITTSYMGATDLKAVQFLDRLSATELKVTYDTHRTRLHAKSYLFHRNSGFGSAYIGSSNISQAALTDGLEWNVKISQYEQPFQWDKVSATFETYWNDSEFESYNGDRDQQRLQNALSQERQSAQDEGELVLPNFDLQPYGFQQEILDRLMVERQLQNRHKHLIVAATGTGKTMIAAFDFKQWMKWRREKGMSRRPRMLFVAHREEILKQSLYTFRAVLRDQNFGDLMVGAHRPSQLDQLFISIQTYNSQKLTRMVESEHYDYIVVDEFHHAAAPSYQDLLTHVEPDCLLGLTATPERGDGLDVKSYFDGHVSAEIRLPDAINRKLLCPFQYFGISDSVDYSNIRWQRGGYVKADLDRLLTENDQRAQLVIEKTDATCCDIRKTRGLGFCVSKKHAEAMAHAFTRAGIPAAYLTADSSSLDRNSVQRRLVDLEINFIFVVDIYNEGVDIPEVDTVLFLRPTESLTVFLQQFGRGLRLSDDKDCLTVLDFIGQSHRKFRFDIRLGSLSSGATRPVLEEMENDFPHTPAGCTIQFERQAKEYVLENIRQAWRQDKPQIIRNIGSFTEDTGQELTLPNFMEYYRLSLDDIYRRASWNRLCVEAGVRDDFHDPDESRLTKGLRRLAHINDAASIEFYDRCLASSPKTLDSLSTLDRRRLLMLHFTLWGSQDESKTLYESIARVWSNRSMRSELREMLGIRRASIASVAPEVEMPFETPLQLHAEYTRDQILSGLGHWDYGKTPSMREGVLHLSKLNTDAFLVTLNKAEKHYSPTTMYEDYAISERLFHWQSQSTTSAESPTGQRYINHRDRDHSILLFVREDRRKHAGLANPYHFLGPADYVRHEGSRPISFVWQLRHPMPAHLLRQTSRLTVV